VKQLAEVLSLDLPPEIDCGDIVASAHARLAELAEDVAGCVASEAGQAESLLDQTTRLSETIARVAHAAAQRPAVASSQRESQHVGPAMRDNVTAVAPRSSPAQSVAMFAADDPDPGLYGRVATAVSACRRSRCPVSVVLVQLDHYDELIVAGGLSGAANIAGLLGKAVEGICARGDEALQIDDARFAIVRQDCDRQHALEWTRRLVSGVQQWSQQRGAALPTTVTISAGVATLAQPPKSFPPQELIDAAQRCLFAAQSSGGAGIKSIDL
jgi:GGDEF domain-containing protein